MCADCCTDAGECEGDCGGECEFAQEETPEGNLIEALAYLQTHELEAMLRVVDSHTPICVGTWGVDGEKQSYTCLMGTVACELVEKISVNDLVRHNTMACDVSDWLTGHGRYDGTRILSTSAVYDVPEAFDNWAAAEYDRTYRSAGNETSLLTGSGRQEIGDMVTRILRQRGVTA